jgi:hypothetical protein
MVSRIGFSLLALVVAGGCAGTDATAPSARAVRPSSDAVLSESPVRSGALHFTKECSEYLFQAGSFCTVNSSELDQIEVGSRITFVARFLGKQIEYTYEIVEYEPLERLVMRTHEGPFPMETCYT